MTPPPRSVLVTLLAAVALAGLPALASAASTDPDHDGLPSSYETSKTLTNPSRADSNGNGIPDGSEPRQADTHGDKLRDDREDPDHDALTNAFEFKAGTHPLRSDTDRDGIRDDRENPDNDGLSNLFEQ